MDYANIKVKQSLSEVYRLTMPERGAWITFILEAFDNNGPISKINIDLAKRAGGADAEAVDFVLRHFFYLGDDGNYYHADTLSIIEDTLEKSDKARIAAKKMHESRTRVAHAESSKRIANAHAESLKRYAKDKEKEKDNNPLYIPNGIYAPPTGGAHPSDDFDDDLGEYDDDTDNDDSYCGNDAPQRAPSGLNSASNASGDELSVEAISDEKNGTFDDVAPTVQKAKKSKSKSGDVVEAVRPDDIPADLWSEWKRVRKDKGAKFLSQRAWDAIVRDAAAANVTIVQAVEIMVENHWRGFFPDSPAVQKWRDKTSVAHIASNQSTYVSLEGSDVYGSENYQLAPTHKANTKDYNYNIKPMVVPEHILKARAGFIPMHKVPGQIDDMTKWLVPKEYCSMDTAEKIAEFRRHVGLPTTNKTLQYFYEKAKAENENNNASSFAVRNLAQDKNAPY